MDARGVVNALGQEFGMGVVFGQAGAVVAEGVEGSGGDDAGLAEASAELLFEAAGAVDEGAVSAEGGAYGGAQAF